MQFHKQWIQTRRVIKAQVSSNTKAQKGKVYETAKEGQKPPGERCSGKQMTGQQTADQETGEISGYNQGTRRFG